MRMTIDEAIYCMKSYLPSDDYTHCTECKYYGCKGNKTCKSNEAHQKAIETMRKYQKIVPALVNYDLLNPIADVKTIDGEGIYINLSDLQDYIHKVVEDDMEIAKAYAFAIDTMRKYQKINNLVKFYENAGTIPTFVLKEIIEDGQDIIKD